MSSKITFVIKINDAYKFQCIVVDKYSKETTIQLHNIKQQEYLLSTSLIDKNSSIEFAVDLFTNPHDFKLYNIEFYGKEYSVISEVLFALIINEFKEQIEKEFIIENTIVELPVNNLKVNSRIITALNAIGLDQIQLEDDEEEIEYQYKEQGEILQEIITKKQDWCKREKMIEKANEIVKEQKMEEIHINNDSLLSEQDRKSTRLNSSHVF